MRRVEHLLFSARQDIAGIPEIREAGKDDGSKKMGEQIDLITSAEANKYIYQQLKQLLLPEGFIVRPGKSKYLVRLRDHNIQMVYQEILYGQTYLQVILVPAWTYQEGWFFANRIILKRTNAAGVDSNFYHDAAFRQGTSLKTYYDRTELARMWKDGIHPQLQEEVIDFFNKMDFDAFAELCENRGSRRMHYGSSSPACALFAAGYSQLLKRQYEKGEEYLRQAVTEAQKKIAEAEPYGGLSDPMYAVDLGKGTEVLEILEKRGPGYQEAIESKLALLEKEAVAQNYQITLNDKKETVKVKTERKSK